LKFLRKKLVRFLKVWGGVRDVRRLGERGDG
jgi:hypothetical protein